MKTLYSVPGAVEKTGLEYRLHTILKAHSPLSRRRVITCTTTALGVGLSLCALRPHTSPKTEGKVLVGELVALPSGVLVRAYGVSKVGQDQKPVLWSTDGSSRLPVIPRYSGLCIPGVRNVIEVRSPLGADTHVTTADGGVSTFGPENRAYRWHLAESTVGMVGVSSGPWQELAYFDRQGKQLSGESASLTWEQVPNHVPAYASWALDPHRQTQDFRMVATDSRGKEYEIPWRRHCSPPRHTIYFAPPSEWPIAKEKIVTYRCETRPWTWVRFTGWKSPKE